MRQALAEDVRHRADRQYKGRGTTLRPFLLPYSPECLEAWSSWKFVCRTPWRWATWGMPSAPFAEYAVCRLSNRGVCYQRASPHTRGRTILVRRAVLPLTVLASLAAALLLVVTGCGGASQGPQEYTSQEHTTHHDPDSTAV